MQSSAAAVHSPPSKPPSPPPPSSSDLPLPRKPRLRRRIRNPALPGVASRARTRRSNSSPHRRRSGPSTPLLNWKVSDDPRLPPLPPSAGQRVGGDEEEAVGRTRLLRGASARELAAGIWRLRPADAAGGGGGRRGRVDLETVPRNLEIQLHCNPLSVDLRTFKRKKNEFASPVSVLSPKSGDFHKMKHFSGLSNPVLEKATKWDPESSMTAEEVYRFYSHLKLLDEEEVSRASLVSTLQTELEQARVRISELETERQTSKKKLDRFLKRLSEEKTAWRTREHEKVRAVIDGMKDDLKDEKKRRRRLEIVNSKLVDELAEAKLNVKRHFQDYEKERKSREVIEEVCDELVKEIADDKADIEALKMEALKIREEFEEEKKMLQMAEVWREERVQMKLIDAKLTLEEKYLELIKLKAELEAFMKNSDSGAFFIREAELLKDKINFEGTEGIKEFSYKPPPAFEDIYAVFEELQQWQETDEKEIQPCSGYTPTSQASHLDMASPSTDVFLEQPGKELENEFVDRNDDLDDDNDWETTSHDEDKGTNNSHDGSEPSVSGYCKKSDESVGGTYWEDKEKRNLNNEIVEAFPTNAKQYKKKVSSICRLWRSSAQDAIDVSKKADNGAKNGRLSNARMSSATLSSNNEDNKKVSVDIGNGRLSNSIAYSGGLLSPDIGFGELGYSPGRMDYLSSPKSLNPHATRGIKGCIDWPRNSQKHNLKSKLIETKAESQKVQLRQVLEQKM